VCARETDTETDSETAQTAHLGRRAGSAGWVGGPVERLLRLWPVATGAACTSAHGLCAAPPMVGIAKLATVDRASTYDVKVRAAVAGRTMVVSMCDACALSAHALAGRTVTGAMTSRLSRSATSSKLSAVDTNTPCAASSCADDGSDATHDRNILEDRWLIDDNTDDVSSSTRLALVLALVLALWNDVLRRERTPSTADWAERPTRSSGRVFLL
jgi:hypothetical protein